MNNGYLNLDDIMPVAGHFSELRSGVGKLLSARAIFTISKSF